MKWELDWYLTSHQQSWMTGEKSYSKVQRKRLLHAKTPRASAVTREKIWDVLSCCSQPENGRKRERYKWVNRLARPLTEANRRLLAFLSVCWNVNQLPGGYFSFYLERLADRQIPPQLAYAGIFWTFAHNRTKSSKYFFLWTLHLSQNFALSSSVPFI